MRSRHILTPNGASQTKASFVGELNGFGFAVKGHGDQHRAENLLLNDLHIRRDIDQHGRGDKIAMSLIWQSFGTLATR